MKRFWKAWKRLAHRIGNFQARLLLTLLYLALVFPFGLAVRLFSDPLRIRQRPARWLGRDDSAADMNTALRQW